MSDSEIDAAQKARDQEIGKAVLPLDTPPAKQAPVPSVQMPAKGVTAHVPYSPSSTVRPTAPNAIPRMITPKRQGFYVLRDVKPQPAPAPQPTAVAKGSGTPSKQEPGVETPWASMIPGMNFNFGSY